MKRRWHVLLLLALMALLAACAAPVCPAMTEAAGDAAASEAAVNRRR